MGSNVNLASVCGGDRMWQHLRPLSCEVRWCVSEKEMK